MSLLLLFGYPNPASIPISELVETAPAPSNGVEFQRDAVAGEWRFVLELADPADGTSAVWRDVSNYYAGDQYSRGGDTYKGIYRASVATLQLQIDDSDMLAPWGQDTSSIFGFDVRLDAGMLMRFSMIRVVAGVVAEWEPVWTMRVETWGDATEARGQIRKHVVNLVDTIGDLAQVPTFIDAPNTTTWDTWFTSRVLPAAQWLFGVDIYGDTSSAGLPGDLEVTAAVNRMDAGTAPLGLVWRSLRSGRMVIHPAPWDTTNTNRYLNPLLDVYPDGLKFTYFPDYTDIPYIQDDGQQSFGVSKTNAGIINSLQVTWPDGFTTETYLADDPVSASKYGVRPLQATWILSNPPVVDDILADRAYASAQALPLRTTLDYDGFFPAMALVDQFDPVTVVHATRDDGLVVTATGVIRNIVEQRTYNGAGGLAWQSTVQIDIDATETSPALLPVESLALVEAVSPGLGGASLAEFSWINPTQPDITPTDVQMRLRDRIPVWFPKDYPGVGADGTVIGYLEAGTAYTFDVRLVRRVNGVAVAFSAARSIRFTTPFNVLPVPVPGDDPTDTNVDMDDVPFDDCTDDVSIDLQENDGSGWVTVDTFSGAEIAQDADGVWHLVDDIPNSFFNEGSMYRFRGFCGADLIVTGTPFDPPDDWSDPCTTPPATNVLPWDDASLLVYVPQVCAPDTIREWVSGIAGVHGPALGEIGALLGGDPNQRVLVAIDDPAWSTTPGGILAYGECPQIVGHTADKTIGVRTTITDADFCVLFECAGMRITCTPTVGGWQAGAIAFAAVGTATVLSGTLALATEYWITATYDAATGDLTLFVDAVEDNSTTFGAAMDTVGVLPIWRVGAPPASWVTDCAVWDRVLASSEMPPSFTNSITFDYTGSEQTWTVPVGVTTIGLVLEGAQGSNIAGGSLPAPGLGGKLVSRHTVTPGETIRVYVGGSTDGTGSYKQGGWPNGGAAQSGGLGGGGGSTDIRQGGATTAHRIAVAGGGSGSAAGYANGRPDRGGAHGAGDGVGDTGSSGSTTPSGAGQGGQLAAGGTGGAGDNNWGADDGANGTTAGQGGDGGEFHASGAGGGKTGGGGGGGGLGPASGGGGSGGVFSGTVISSETGERAGHGRATISW